MKPTPQNRIRPSHHFLARASRRRLRPDPQFPDNHAAAADLDGGCWLEIAGGAAIAIRAIADHREDPDA